MTVVDALNDFDDVLWYIPLVLIVLLGIYSTVRLRGVQVRDLKEMCTSVFSRENREGGLSSFHVFCMSMGTASVWGT